MSYPASSLTIKLKYIGVLLGIFLLSINLSVSIADNNHSITYNLDDLELAWSNWKNNHITTSGAGNAPRQRVLGGVSNVSTVSEGQAYGMLFASLFNEQVLFDGLWLFAADHLNDNGLMHWHIWQHGIVAGTGAATDSDLDMAIAMVIACQKFDAGLWSASENNLDYCQIATDLITRIWKYEVDHPNSRPAAGLSNNKGYELIPGDSWSLARDYPDGIVNLSYFSPGYFRVFADFTGNTGWYAVIDRNYEIADLSQQIDGNCSGLVPNWSKYDGQYQYVPWHGTTSEYWGYDGARFAWRVAVDSNWFGDPDAQETMNEIGGFFSSIGINDVRTEYRMSGTYVNSGRNPFFVSTAASSIWSAPAPIASNCGQATGTLRSTPQQAYEAVVNIGTQNYYNDSWRLLAMILMTDNFPNPQTIRDSVVSTPTPSQTTQVTPGESSISDTSNFHVIAKLDQDVENNTQFAYQITNLGTETVNSVSAHIYFDLDSDYAANDYQLEIYYDSTNNLVLSDPQQWDANTYYFTVDYGNAALNRGKSFMFNGALHLKDWSASYDSTNDWWYSDLTSEYTVTSQIPVYVSGIMQAGQEPNGMTVPQQSQSTPTVMDNSIQTPGVTTTDIPRASATSTHIPSPEKNNTAQLLSISIRQEGNDNSQQSQFRYQLRNDGVESISGLSTRLFFDLDSEELASNYVMENYYDSSNNAIISGPNQWDNETYYYTVSYDATLNSGTTFEFVGAFRLENWSPAFDSSNDWWRKTIGLDYTVTTYVPVYINGVIAFGQEPPAN